MHNPNHNPYCTNNTAEFNTSRTNDRYSPAVKIELSNNSSLEHTECGKTELVNKLSKPSIQRDVKLKVFPVLALTSELCKMSATLTFHTLHIKPPPHAHQLQVPPQTGTLQAIASLHNCVWTHSPIPLHMPDEGELSGLFSRLDCW